VQGAMTYSLEHTFEQKIKNKKFKKQNQQNETKIFRHFKMKQKLLNDTKHICTP
jgi:hypothetical protein